MPTWGIGDDNYQDLIKIILLKEEIRKWQRMENVNFFYML
jgi:hypothetical protein